MMRVGEVVGVVWEPMKGGEGVEGEEVDEGARGVEVEAGAGADGKYGICSSHNPGNTSNPPGQFSPTIFLSSFRVL